MTERQQQLIDLAAERPDLRDTVVLYQEIIRAQDGVSLHQFSMPPSPAAVLEQVDAGQPIAELCTESFDWPEIAGLARAVCEITARHRPELATDLSCLGAWLSDVGETMLAPYLLGVETPVPKLDDLTLMPFVLNHAFYPWLQLLRRKLDPLPVDRYGQRGNCLLCGEMPDLAYLHPQTGQRYLICARCDTEWVFRRVGCPFCGDTQEGSKYFVDETHGLRVYGCDACGRYLKTIDRRVFWKRYTPLVERIRTADADIMARHAGYR